MNSNKDTIPVIPFKTVEEVDDYQFINDELKCELVAKRYVITIDHEGQIRILTYIEGLTTPEAAQVSIKAILELYNS